MQRGDVLLLVGLTCVGLALGVDGLSGAAFSTWLSTNLSALGGAVGRTLGWLGWAMTPLIIAPFLIGVVGRFTGLPTVLTSGLTRAIKAIDAVSVTIADLVRWAALALVLVTAAIVIQRYVFGVSITKLQESVIYLHAVLFLLSSAATLYNGGHVRVDIIYSKLTDRGRAWTDMLGVYLALIPMCWLILDTSQSYVGGAWRILERSRESDGLPLVFLLKTAIPVFAVMMIAQGTAMASRAALVLSGATPPPAGHDDAEHEL